MFWRVFWIGLAQDSFDDFLSDISEMGRCIKTCHLGHLSLGNFDINSSWIHVHIPSPGAGVDLPPPPQNVTFVKNVTFVTYMMGGCFHLEVLDQTGNFWRPNLSPD